MIHTRTNYTLPFLSSEEMFGSCSKVLINAMIKFSGFFGWRFLRQSPNIDKYVGYD